MTNQELIRALRAIKVETGSLACMGCGHEHNCGIHGCAIMSTAADRLDELSQRVPQWIPVTERLPENGVPVLANYIGNDNKYHPDGTVVWTDWGCFWWEGSLNDCDIEVAVPITHWMPLPEPPEDEQ